MFVVVTDAGEVALLAVDVLDALHVEAVAEMTTTELTGHLSAAGAGRDIGALDEVGLDVSRLGRGVLAALGSAATDGFDAMVSYAAGRGWVSADGATLHAHRQPPATQITTAATTASADNH